MSPMDATTDAKMADLTVELDSEEEPAIDSPKPTNPSKPSRTMAMLSNLTANDSESDSDDAPVKIPRGKLVSRLVQKIDVESSEEEAEEDPQAAYERIKQQMMAEKNKVEAPKPEIRVDKRVDATNIVTDDEDDLPVRPQKNRKPMANFQRRATSAPSLSPASSRRSSPGLFVSPRKKSPALPAADSDSDSDDAAKIRRKLDLEERIKRAREKRKAQQAEERQKEQQKSKHTHGSATSDADSDDNGRRLTQQTRPTRKAGKKALEEMSRENQRINRNMQLAHQAKTKKKYSVKDLFKVMDYKQENEEPAVASPDPIAANSALISSDAEQGRLQDTPPTSPPSQDDHEKDQTCVPDESAIPVLASAGGKGKGRAPEFAHVPMNPYITAAASSGPIKVDNASVETKESSDTVMIDLDSDSDDGAEANVSKTRKRLSVFDRVPHAQQKESRPLLNLRHLAHLTGPAQPSVKGRTSMNNTELQISLLRKARQQAQRLQQEKIEDLRSRGIVIQTEEEREQEQLEIDNIVERAREANLRLAKKEKEQAKKDGKADDHVLLSSDESGDEDYVGSGEEGPAEEGEEAELELSGSEEEDAADDDMESGEEENDASDAELDANDNLLNQEAEEVGDEVEEESHNGEEDEMDQDLVAAPRSRLIRKSRNVILDEEDDEADDVQHETPQKQYQPVEPTQDDAMAAFGFDTSKSPSLGLTQVFAGTMANLDFDSQPDGAGDANPEENSLDFLRALPDTQPGGLFSPDKLVPNTQIAATPNKIESQNALPSQFSLGISQLILSSSDGPSASQLSELPEPTQDASFTLDRSATEILAPESTVDTVIMSVAESPVVKRKGRLHRRKDLAAQLSDDDDEQPKQHAEKSGNVFEAMKKAAKDKSADNFDKKTSWAKDVVEEQADESEDEYAGLGGASDDDSGEDDEEVAKMIDDESNEKVDERKIAAYYAAKDKADDERNINKLYKDIATGGLRRKRGGDAFDVSDSEDESERRKRRKQAEFQKMQKALLSSNEVLGKIAQNPKQQAFLRTLEDHDDDSDYEDYLNAPPETAALEEDSTPPNEDNAEIAVPDSQTGEASKPPVLAPTIPNPLKRKSTDSQGKENRPPPHMRRTAANEISRKPMTLADVQHSISDLIDEQQCIPESQFSSAESSDEETTLPPRPMVRKPVIDRLALSRTASTTSTDTTTGNLAFAPASAGGSLPGFRIPSLIRRSTSSFSNSTSTSTSGVSTPTEVSTAARRGGTTKSNIHAQAREAERRAALEKVEKRKKESVKRKLGGARGQRSVLGRLDSGFE